MLKRLPENRQCKKKKNTTKLATCRSKPPNTVYASGDMLHCKFSLDNVDWKGVGTCRDHLGPKVMCGTLWNWNFEIKVWFIWVRQLGFFVSPKRSFHFHSFAFQISWSIMQIGNYRQVFLSNPLPVPRTSLISGIFESIKHKHLCSPAS